MNDHFRLSAAERKSRGLSLKRVSPYIVGAALTLPIIVMVGFVMRVVLHHQSGDFGFVLAWITAMAVGLVCSVQCCRLATNLWVAALGAMFFIVYLFGIFLLGILLP